MTDMQRVAAQVSSEPAAHDRCRRPASIWAGACALLTVALAAPQTSAVPPTIGNLVQISGPSPFADCTADHVATQTGMVYLDSEIEPWVDVNPIDSGNIVAGWQQDRWSSGGSRGLYRRHQP
jgi:hypothetical protein